MEKRLEIYQGEEGEVIFDVDKAGETIWATQEQIAQLFGVTVANINVHLKKIYKEAELEEERTIKKNLIVRLEGNRKVKRAVNFYNLDAIISVGYRVNSKKATKFRVWATKILKEYIVDGTAVNKRRLQELSETKLMEIEGTLSMVRRLMDKTELEEKEAKGILEVISKYGKTLEVIKEFGSGAIQDSSSRFLLGKGRRAKRDLNIGEIKNLVENLREELQEGDEFGMLRDEKQFEEILTEIEDGEFGDIGTEKATRLLYYIVKERPFLDGNRRIGALIFIYYLTINDFHLSMAGETKISDRALTAIVLLIAESEKKEKELIIGVVRKLIEG